MTSPGWSTIIILIMCTATTKIEAESRLNIPILEKIKKRL